MSGSIRSNYRRLIAVAAVCALPALIAGCENEGTSDDEAASSSSTSLPLSSTTTTTGAAEPEFVFHLKNSGGYTFDVGISNIRLIKDIASAPPGNAKLSVELAFVIRNTTAGRKIPNAEVKLFAAWKGCGSFCKKPIALIPPGDPGDFHSVSVGGTRGGTFRPSDIDAGYRDEYFPLIPESLSTESIYIGVGSLGCQASPCWMSPSGGAVPADLSKLP